MADPFKAPKAFKEKQLNKSKGILDDFAVRKSVASRVINGTTLNVTGTGAFGSAHKATIGNDASGISGYFEDGANYVSVLDGSTVLDWGNGTITLGGDLILLAGNVEAAAITGGNLQVDNININGAVISSNTGAISFSNENLTTTGKGKFTGGVVNKIASISWGEDPPTTDGGIDEAFGSASNYDDGWTALLYDSVLFSIFQVMSWNDEWYVSTRMDLAPMSI